MTAQAAPAGTRQFRVDCRACSTTDKAARMWTLWTARGRGLIWCFAWRCASCVWTVADLSMTWCTVSLLQPHHRAGGGAAVHFVDQATTARLQRPPNACAVTLPHHWPSRRRAEASRPGCLLGDQHRQNARWLQLGAACCQSAGGCRRRCSAHWPALQRR
jgi:hypothetical protein